MKTTILLLTLVVTLYSAEDPPADIMHLSACSGFSIVVHPDYSYTVKHTGQGMHSISCVHAPCIREGRMDREIFEMYLLAMKSKGLFEVSQKGLDEKHGKLVLVADGGSFIFRIASPHYTADLSKSGLHPYAEAIPENMDLQTAVSSIPMSKAFIDLMFQKAAQQAGQPDAASRRQLP